MDITKSEVISSLHKELMASDGLYEPEVTHTFIDGVYYREMTVLKNTTIVGATHTKECINILISGTLLVSDGDSTVEIEAPKTFVTKAGAQKIGYSITEVVFANIFRTDITDIEKLEDELFVENIYKEKKWLV